MAEVPALACSVCASRRMGHMNVNPSLLAGESEQPELAVADDGSQGLAASRRRHCSSGVTIMALKTTPCDSADYLNTEEDIAEYIAACMDEAGDDPAFIAHALGVVARARNMAQLARDTGMTREGIYKALSADDDRRGLV